MPSALRIDALSRCLQSLCKQVGDDQSIYDLDWAEDAAIAGSGFVLSAPSARAHAGCGNSGLNARAQASSEAERLAKMSAGCARIETGDEAIGRIGP